MKRWSQLDTRLLVALLPSTCVLGPHWKGSVTRWCRGLFPRCSHAAHASEQCQGVLKTDDLFLFDVVTAMHKAHVLCAVRLPQHSQPCCPAQAQHARKAYVLTASAQHKTLTLTQTHTRARAQLYTHTHTHTHTQVFVEQCRCLDIAIAVSPRNTSSLGAAMARQQQQQQQQQQAAGGFGGSSTSGYESSSSGRFSPLTRKLTGGGLEAGEGEGVPGVGNLNLKQGYALVERFGKEFNKNISNFMGCLGEPV
eukprot:1133533-Pelagomonas_calceolata.AAC.8